MDLVLEKSFPASGETPLGAENSLAARRETPLLAQSSFPDPPDIPLGAENYWLWNAEVDAGLEKRPFRVPDAAFVVIRFFDSSGKARLRQVASVSKPKA
jgi:hypothetical protein